MSLSQEEPPEGLEPELKEYLSRRFLDIAVLLDAASKFPERKQMPYKPQFGDEHYFGDPASHDYDPIILTTGTYVFTEFRTPTDPRTGFWNKLVGAAEAINTFAEAGYGGVELSISTAMSNINATPQVVPASDGSVTNPRNIIQDTVNNGCVVERRGIWLINIFLTLAFVDINSGRTIQIELYDDDDSVILDNSPIFVGRNQAGVNISAGLLSDTPPELEGHLFQIRVSSASDTFTAVTAEAFSFNFAHVGNAQSLDPST